jgi:hypothetical protein
MRPFDEACGLSKIIIRAAISFVNLFLLIIDNFILIVSEVRPGAGAGDRAKYRKTAEIISDFSGRSADWVRGRGILSSRFRVIGRRPTRHVRWGKSIRSGPDAVGEGPVRDRKVGEKSIGGRCAEAGLRTLKDPAPASRFGGQI